MYFPGVIPALNMAESWLLHISAQVYILFINFRERGRDLLGKETEREKHWTIASHTFPGGDWTHTFLVHGTMIQPTELSIRSGLSSDINALDRVPITYPPKWLSFLSLSLSHQHVISFRAFITSYISLFITCFIHQSVRNRFKSYVLFGVESSGSGILLGNK